ncbi:hypothetical protein FG386_002771 [Cryptosporidium ryanae]|uniref:uncharacterized protein n=1 Tax=Cryptosporidium ryanae TaxID=515981 RepID=UPI003519DE8D|nr:hypothetical protein FG386_002771 [Cryptosporidium ryanae]
MEELHPLFRDEVPSTSELRTNYIYSALVEISVEKNNVSRSKQSIGPKSEKDVVKVNKISQESKSISKDGNKKVKGRYQRHLNRINSTKQKIRRKRELNSKDTETEDSNDNKDNTNEAREVAEMDMCMSIWSNKQLFHEK